MSRDEAALVLKQVRDALVQVDVTRLEEAEAQLESLRERCSGALLADLHRDLRVTSRFAASSTARLQDQVSRMSVAQFGYAPPGAAVPTSVSQPAGGTCG